MVVKTTRTGTSNEKKKIKVNCKKVRVCGGWRTLDHARGIFGEWNATVKTGREGKRGLLVLHGK